MYFQEFFLATAFVNDKRRAICLFTERTNKVVTLKNIVNWRKELLKTKSSKE